MNITGLVVGLAGGGGLSHIPFLGQTNTFLIIWLDKVEIVPFYVQN